MIRVLIIDDEPAASNILRLLLDKHVSVAREVAMCNDPELAITMIADFRPTLLMLDVQMPGMNGFDLLNSIGSWDFDLIFTTAFDQYAIKAIRFSALDYLLKPIDILDLQNAINRHIIRKAQVFQQPQLVTNLLENLKTDNAAAFTLTLSTSEGVFQFAPKDIIRVEGMNNYSKFFFNSHAPIVVSRTIKEYEELLAEYGFLRVHKSHLVNRIYIRHIDKESLLWLQDGHHVVVSRRKKEEIVQALRG